MGGNIKYIYLFWSCWFVILFFICVLQRQAREHVNTEVREFKTIMYHGANRNQLKLTDFNQSQLVISTYDVVRSSGSSSPLFSCQFRVMNM